MIEFVSMPTSGGKEDAQAVRKIKRLEGSMVVKVDQAQTKLIGEVDKVLKTRRDSIVSQINDKFDQVITGHTKRLERIEQYKGTSTDKALTIKMAEGALEDKLSKIRKEILETIKYL